MLEQRSRWHECFKGASGSCLRLGDTATHGDGLGDRNQNQLGLKLSPAQVLRLCLPHQRAAKKREKLKCGHSVGPGMLCALIWGSASMLIPGGKVGGGHDRGGS